MPAKRTLTDEQVVELWKESTHTPVSHMLKKYKGIYTEYQIRGVLENRSYKDVDVDPNIKMASAKMRRSSKGANCTARPLAGSIDEHMDTLGLLKKAWV